MNSELAWLTIKDFYEEQGESGIQGSKDAIRIALERGLINKGTDWMEMIESRKLTVHTYNIQTAEDVETAVRESYFSLLSQLQNALEGHRSGGQGKLNL